jgi:hypothetical protein
MRKDLSNTWWHSDEYHWNYVVRDSDGYMDLITHVDIPGGAGDGEHLIHDERWTLSSWKGWQSFEPARKQKRLAMKAVFR